MVGTFLNKRVARSALPLAIALATAPLAHARENAGVTLAARGDVEAYDLLDEISRTLSRRSEVFNVDSILTGANSQAQIRMVDDAVISVRSDSELVIAEYQYDEETGEGRATMELVSGGLRALTGSINPENEGSDYEVRTSVGSIGIRGTHYEALQSDSGLLVGAWDGEIELNLSVGEGGGQIILGGNQEYSFASVNQQGVVTFFLEPPAEFDTGHTPEEDDTQEKSADGETTDEPSQDDENETSGDESNADSTEEDAAGGPPGAARAQGAGPPEGVPGAARAQGAGPPAGGPPGLGGTLPGNAAMAAAQQVNFSTMPTPPPFANGERPGQSGGQGGGPPGSVTPVHVPTPPNLVAQRTGTALYNNLISAELDGNRTDFEVTISFRVNFTLGTVDEGKVNLSAEDGVGWLGLFEGGISGNEMQIGPAIGDSQFNSALYTDADGVPQEASGHLNGTFYGINAEQVWGDFFFEHLNDSSVWVSGDYVVGESD